MLSETIEEVGAPIGCEGETTEAERRKNRSMTPKLPTLPQELIVEILSRLPVKSLLQFRCVCKPWKTLINDPTFIKTHLNRSNRDDNNDISLIVGNYSYLSVVDSKNDVPTKIDLPFKSSLLKFELSGSCNGLLCLFDVHHEETTVYLWNPSTRDYLRLPNAPSMSIPNQPGSVWSRQVAFGFGFSPATDEYKVVRIVQYVNIGPVWDIPAESEVSVFTLGTNCWRKMGESPYRNVCQSSRAVLNGCIHWMGTNDCIENAYSDLIIAFDVGLEEFREIPMPDFVPREDYLVKDVRVLRGCLSLVFHGFNDDVEVWIMKDYGSKEASWTKHFSIEGSMVSRDSNFFRILDFWRNGEMLVEKNVDKLICYDPVSKREWSSNFRWISDVSEVVTYVGSLVSIRANNGVHQRNELVNDNN